jgi:hypothetical protein
MNFQSQFAKVEGQTVNIHQYMKGDKKAYCINNNHELIPVQGSYNKWHFRHLNSSDCCTQKMSYWHAEWQGHFENTEVSFKQIANQIKERRADIVENDFIIEIQHSCIEKEEVLNRNHDYKLHNKKVIWIIDGNKGIDVNTDSNILDFKEDWKYNSFIDCNCYNNYIYIDIKGLIYRINPNDVKSCMIKVSEPLLKPYFIDLLKNNIDLWETPLIHQCHLFIRQSGAGNGKTYQIINMIQKEQFNQYNKFIFVTKQHSARNIMKEEFRNQYESGALKITDLELKDLKKKYVYSFKIDGISKTLIIATIDSFMFSLGNKENKSFDLFEGIVESIVNDHIEIENNGKIRFANVDPRLCSETLYVIDESQDLLPVYADALIKIMKYTHMDAYVVGDKLQSISNEINALTQIMECDFSKLILKPENICRRFSHPILVNFVNHMVPFGKHTLPPVSVIEEKVYDEPLVMISLNRRDNGREQLDKIMYYFEKEVNTYDYLPEDFLIVTPFVSQNPFVNGLHMAIEEFWINKLKDPDYRDKIKLKSDFWKNHIDDVYYNYAVFHKSEEGSSINLDDSIHSTRIVSIHSSKGDGRNVVFALDLKESSLKRYSGMKDSLIYDSLLHVAITRMKKKLYIECANDDIGRKVREFMALNDIEMKTHADELLIENKIKVNDIIQLCGNKVIEYIDTYYDDEYSESKQIIDMSHHNIRFGIMLMKICISIQDEKYDRNSHIQTILNKALTSPIITTKSWKEYNTLLWKSSSTFANINFIPLIQFKGKEYAELYEIIHTNIMLIKETGNKNLHKLCPLQCIIFYYMVDITSNGKNGNITILELYKIVHTYKNSYTPTKGHETCMCNQFKTSNNLFSIYLKEHYDKMKHLNKIMEQLKDNYPNTSWNPNCTLEYNGLNKEFIITTKVALIGYNENSIILCYIKPEINKLNYTETKIKSFIDSFIIRNIDESKQQKYEKYNGKRIIICIIALNKDEPFIIDFDNEDIELKKILNTTLYDYYSIKNKEVVQYYNSFQGNYSEFCDEYNKMNAILLALQPPKQNATYITRTINGINSIYDEMDDKENFIGKLNFLERLTKEMKKTIDKYLK